MRILFVKVRRFIERLAIEDKSRRCSSEGEGTLKLLFGKVISEFFLELGKNGYEVTESGKWDIVYVSEYFVSIIWRRTGEIYVHRGFWVEDLQEIPIVVLNYCNVNFLLKFNQIRDNFDTQSLGDNLFLVSSKTRYRKNSTGHVISSSHKGLKGTLSIHQLTWHKFMPALSSCWLPVLCATFHRVFTVYFFHNRLLKLFVSLLSYNFTQFFRYFAEAQVSTRHPPCNNFFLIIFNRRYISFLIGLKARRKICSNILPKRDTFIALFVYLRNVLSDNSQLLSRSVSLRLRSSVSKQDRYIRRQLVLVPNDYSSYKHHWNTR